ncbi:hypothetical protein GGD83_004440 [Rhodoblastus sphagnicola]|uniref:methyltransferase n=1 Tax=Rhodoblastus sphagnicola TaxID=333368 RepID=UPI00182236B3|nr:methyltransferase [Rhodoblastus sphagnicola]MBB4200611.1 hypothetical protein [Rhodoblastus sphagnicola]
MKMSSHAVRAQRVEPRTSLDDFPTPCWGTRSLVEEVLAQTDIGVPEGRVFEPTANRGYMSRPLKEYWPDVTTSDIFDYRPDPETIDPQDHVGDFLAAGETVATTAEIIISNPPFKAAQAFITRALALPDWRLVAMLTRSSFVEGETRYHGLFADSPPQFICQFVQRLPIIKSRVRKWKRKPTSTTPRGMRQSTATSYSWLVWWRGAPTDWGDPRFRFIPPCRDRLERPGDYPDE